VQDVGGAVCVQHSLSAYTQRRFVTALCNPVRVRVRVRVRARARVRVRVRVRGEGEGEGEGYG